MRGQALCYQRGMTTPPRFDTLAIGNAIVDVLAPADDAFLVQHGIAKGAMTLVDEFRAHQLFEAMTDAPALVSGGSAANTAAGIASLGGRAAFMGKVKADAPGAAFARDIRAAGVAFDTAPAADGPATARCHIFVTPDAQRSMNTYLGACRELGPEDIDPARVADAAILYLEGYLWDPERAKAAIRDAIGVARAHGRRVALSLSDPFCVGRWRDEFRALLARDVDIVFANEEEAKSLVEKDRFDDVLQAFKAWSAGGKLACLTRSEKGSVLVSGDEVHVIDAAPARAVVDTTGAGDLYAAGVLHGLATGKSLADCGRLGALCAAEVIGYYGPRPKASLKALAEAQGL